MAATIKDVAKAAGVSISTVSYALSGKRPIGEKTRRSIEAAIAELGYAPNAGARALAGRRTYILAVTEPLRPDTYEPAHMAFILATARAARQFDYDILLLTQEEAVEGLERVANSRIVDGIIVLDVLNDDERTDLVRKLGVPATLIGMPGDTTGLTCVDLDFDAAAGMAVDRFVDGGAKKIGLLGHAEAVYSRGSNFPVRVRDGFIRRAERRGAEVRFATAEPGASGLAAAIDKLLGENRDLDGLAMHCDDQTQARVLELLLARGYEIPRDLSVISVASTFDTSTFSPPLDVIPLIPEESCTRAVELIIEEINGSRQKHLELLAPTYIERGSTRAVGI